MKAYVIDTGVLLDDPDIFNKLGPGNTLIIPTAVIKELDTNKNGSDRMAKAARKVARLLDNLGSFSDLIGGAQLPFGAILRTCTGYEKIEAVENDIDNRVIGTALKLKSEFPNIAVVSTDRAVRDAARSFGLEAQNYPFYLTGMDKPAPSAAAAQATAKTEKAPHKKGFFKRLLRLLGAA